MRDPAQFKLDSASVGSVVVGDRYVHRDKSAEIVEVTSTHIVIEVVRAGECFTKSVTVDEFPELERRTFASGAVFKPANNRPQIVPNEDRE